jgi:hypothetical protein
MELSPFWEAASCAAIQELPSILWNPKVQYRVHESPALVLILNQIYPTHTTPSYLSKIHFSIVHPLRLGLSSGLFPCGFPTNILYAFLLSPFMLNALPISSSLTCSFWLYLANNTSYEPPHYAVFSNLPSLHISSVQTFSSTPCSQTPSIYVLSLMSEIKFHTSIEPQAKL